MRFVIYLLFFASGISGLVYEIVWMRKLALVFGCTAYATSAVLSAFMGGLALGSFLLGSVVDRWGNPLRLYGFIEIGIALTTIAVMLLLLPVMDSVYVQAFRTLGGAGAAIVALRLFLAILILIVPTTLMGGTLPVISKFLVRRKGSLGLEIGNLYAINTVGAVVGCFATGFIFIRALGETNTVAIAVAINLAVGAITLILASRFDRWASTEQSRAALPHDLTDSTEGYVPSSLTTGRLRAALWAFGLAGFASLAYEVIWTRLLINVVGSDVYCFTVILTTFLFGIMLGSFVIARMVDRIRNLYLTFGLFELAIGLVALASIPLMDALPGFSTSVTGFFSNAGLTDTPFARRTVAMFALAFLIFIGPTFLMGAVFPLVNKIYHQSIRSVGRNVGHVYSVNTLGTILGAAAGGFLILPLFGIAGSVVAVSVINLGIGVSLCFVAPRSESSRKVCWLGAGAALASLTVAVGWGWQAGIPGYVREQSGTRIPYYKIPYYKETPAATLYVTDFPRIRNLWGYPVRQLVINRHPTAHNVYLDMVVHKMLAHVPLLMHPDPQRALVVGFGLGSTSYSMLQHAALQVDCVELLKEEIDTAGYFERENRDIINGADRFNLIINDGRNYVLAADVVYDVISVNAVDPRLSPALYTRDFLQLCRMRMPDDGMMALWLPTYSLSTPALLSIYKSFLDVFPFSFVFYSNPGHFLLVGSPEPISIDLDKFQDRAALPAVRDSLAEVCLDDPLVLLSTLVLTPEGLTELVRGAPLNTDLRPKVEFDRREETKRRFFNPEFFKAVLKHQSSILPYLQHDADAASENSIRRMQQLAEQQKKWMHAQFDYYMDLRPQGMAQMMRALEGDRENLFLKTSLLTFTREVIGAPFFEPHLRSFMQIAEDVLEANPAMAHAHHYLAMAAARMGEVGRAARHSEAVDRLRPDDWFYHFVLGQRYLPMGRTDDARRCFQRTLEMNSGRAGGLYGLAILQVEKGDYQAARDRLREALRADPDFAPARSLLTALQARLRSAPK